MNQHVRTVPADDVATGEFKTVMRQVAGAVSVITAQHGGVRAGLTATSLTALSADPPTVIICVNRGASSWPVIESAAHFAINLLADDQRAIADRFAGRGGEKGEARFARATWHKLATGAPILASALATIDCITEEVIERHSQALLIGRVKAIRASSESNALLYWRGLYRQITDIVEHGAGI